MFNAIIYWCNPFVRDRQFPHSASYIGTLCIFLAHLYWVTIFSEGWIGYVYHLQWSWIRTSLPRRKLIRSCKISAASISKCGEAQEETIHGFHTIYITNFFPIASRNNNLSARNPKFVETSHIPNTHHHRSTASKNPQITRCFFFSPTQSTLVAPRGESNVGNFVPDPHRSLPIDPQPHKTTAKNSLKAQFEL